MAPETERAFVALAVARGVVSAAQVESLQLESRRAASLGRPLTLSHLLVERGVVDRQRAGHLLREVRAIRSAAAAGSTVAEPLPRPAAPPPRPAERAAPAPPPPAAGALASGRDLGPYRITGELGRGGMGVVYRALDRRLNREVAIKTISGLADQEATERFVREARAAARLRHPGIVQVLDAGTLGGTVFVALELVAGGSLQKKLEAGPLAPHDAATLVRELALAVEAAHAAGIVHRDLKPANVLLDTSGNAPGEAGRAAIGRPRLTDFGLARDETGASLTETGVALGTPAYMAPEQANADKTAIGPRTDVYGLGAVLYHCLTGSAPFQGGGGLAVMHKVVTEDVESPTRRRAARQLAPLARDLETIVLKALEKRPERRYSSARELSEDLGRHLAGEAILARAPSAWERAGRAARRHRVSVLLAGLALALGALAALVVQVRAGQRLQAESDRLQQEARRAHEDAVGKARGALKAALDRFASSDFANLQRLVEPSTFSLRLEGIGAAVMALNRAREFAEVARDDEGRTQQVKTAQAVFDWALHYDVAWLATLAEPETKDHVYKTRLEDFNRGEEGRQRARNDANDLRVFLATGPQELERVRERVEGCLARDPECMEALDVLAYFEVHCQDYRAAMRTLDRLLKIDPNYAAGYSIRADCELKLGEIEAAESDLARALALAPKNDMTLLGGARVALARRDYALALERANAVLNTRPQNHVAAFIKGTALLNLRRPAEAIPSLRQAIADCPSANRAIDYRLNLVNALFAASRPDEARGELRAVLVDPNATPEQVTSARQSLAQLGER